MKKIGFIGAFDKIDTIIYIAKIVRETGKRVLVIDSTIQQKARYIVPVIKRKKMYVTNFEGIDVAVGFYDFESIEEYLKITHTIEEYDYIFVDIDSTQVCKKFNILDFDNNYFVAAFDLYSLKRGIEIIGKLNPKINFTKVLFTNKNKNENNKYVDFLSEQYKIMWNKNKIYFPYLMEDLDVIAENQRVQKIKLKKFSPQYKSSLISIAGEILNEEDAFNLDKILKKIERGV